MRSFAVVVALLSLFVFACLADDPCDFTLGSFQVDLLTHVGLAKNYFKREGLDNFCIQLVFSSIGGYNSLLNGTLDVLHAAFDNTYIRKVGNPPVGVSMAASTDLGSGLVILGNKDTVPTLADVAGKVYAADAPSTGFIPLAYEAARLSGVDLGSLSNVSGFNDDQRLELTNGDVVRGETAEWGMFSLLWGIPEYYEPLYPNVHLLGTIEEYVWPLQAGCYSVPSGAQSNPVQFDKLRRYFRGLLKAYRFATRRSTRRKVIDIIEERRNLSPELSEAIYDCTIGRIDQLTGVSPFIVPNKRGVFNVAALRYNQGTGPAPGLVDITPGPEKLVDLRALSAAFDDLRLGSAVECYESPELDDCR